MKINIYNNKGIRHQLIAALTGTLFAVSDGMTFGWTAPFIPYLQSEHSHIKTDESHLEWLETGFLIGSFCGLPLTIILVSRIGRKKSLLLASGMILIAWIIILTANNIDYIIFARFVCGISGNMAFVAAPMYIAEIADQQIRGFLASIVSIYMLIGCLTVYCIGPFLPFYVPCIIGIIVALAELVIFFSIPESPTYLLSKNQMEAAAKSLEYFNPTTDIEYELQALSQHLANQNAEKFNFKDLFLDTSNRKSLLIMTVLNAGQHFGAYSVILMNLHILIEKAGTVYIPCAYTAILFATSMLVAAVAASSQIDRFGRKVLLKISCTLTVLCLLSISVYFHLQHLGVEVLPVSWIPIVAVMVYALGFKMGIGLVPLVITAEIFPNNIKAFGMTLADLVFIVSGIISIQLYHLLKPYGLYIPFYVFTFSSFLVLIFTIGFIPETKGKSLEEIQELLVGRNKQKFEQKTNNDILFS